MVLAGQTIQPGQGHAAGRQLLQKLYREHVGGDFPEIQRTERGKPCFVGSPWHFSITHTKKHVFCALSEYPIGIDAEELDRSIHLRLAEKILSPGERRQYLQAQDPRLALLRFWVLKEATAKCSGRGWGDYLYHTDFCMEDARIQIKDSCLLAVIEEK